MAASPMASSMRILLRLPPCLRQSIFRERVSQSTTANGRHSLTGFQSRTFTCSKHAARPQPPPKPLRKGSRPQAPPPPQRPTRPAAPRSPAHPPESSSRIDRLAPDLEKVLLYKAPRHGSFFVLSYLAGATLLFGASNMAHTFLKDRPGWPKSPWYIKVMSVVPAFFMVIMGTACILAPMKMIKSVAIVTESGARVLRFEIKRPLPFMKPDILQTPVSKVALNRRVHAFATDSKYQDIRLSEMKAFTENYFSKTQQAPESRGIRGAISSFNKSLLNVWPATKRDIRRIFTRDQMAYVSVEGNGNFKLDLQECSILDQGKPLEYIIQADEQQRPSIASWIMRLLG